MSSKSRMHRFTAAGALIREIEGYPIGDVPGATGLWAVSGDQLHAGLENHWHRLGRICQGLYQLPDATDTQFIPLRGRIASLMTALSAHCWQEVAASDWHARAEGVISRYVPALHTILRGAAMDDEKIAALSLDELRAAIRVVRNARRGVVPQLMALGEASLLVSVKRSKSARLELQLAEQFARAADAGNAAVSHDFLWMARFDLYRALGEERLAAPSQRVDGLTRQLEELEHLLLNSEGVPERYRLRTMGFSMLFHEAAGLSRRSGAALQEMLLHLAAASQSLIARETKSICLFNVKVARGDDSLKDVVEELLCNPGVLIREKSLLTPPAAAVLRAGLASSMPGLCAHLDRELSLVAPRSWQNFCAAAPAAFESGGSNRAAATFVESQDTQPKPRKCRISIDQINHDIWIDGKAVAWNKKNLCHVMTKLIAANGGGVPPSLLADPRALPNGGLVSLPTDWLKDTMKTAPKELKCFIARCGGPKGGRRLVDEAFC